jgi:hypothetical protein
VAPKATRFFLRLLHYLKQLPRLDFTSVVTLSGIYLGHLDRHLELDAKTQPHNEEALAA